MYEHYRVVESGFSFVIINDEGIPLGNVWFGDKIAALDLCAAMNYGRSLRIADGK